MTGIISVIGICVITASATLFLKQYKPDMAFLAAVIGGCAVLLATLYKADNIFSELRDIFDSLETDNEIFAIMLKCLGITVITDFAAELCKDFGQSSLGSRVILAEKVVVVTLCLPLIKNVINTAVELIG